MLDDLLIIFKNDPVSGVVLVILVLQWFRQKNVESDDAHTTQAIALASTVVATFEPLRLLLVQMLESFKADYAVSQQAIHEVDNHVGQIQAAQITQMEVLARLFENSERQHGEIAKHLVAHDTHLKAISEMLIALQVPETLRQQFADLVATSKSLRIDVSELLAQQAQENKK